MVKEKALSILIGVSCARELLEVVKKCPERRVSLIRSYNIREKSFVKINKINTHFKKLSPPLKTLAYFFSRESLISNKEAA